LRLGATGKERVTAINSLFKQIIQIIMPGYLRFLFGISSEPSEKNDEGNENPLLRNNTHLCENSLNLDL